MGTICSKASATNTVGPVKESTNHLVSALNDAVIGKQNTKSLDVTVKQPVSNANDHSRQNSKRKLHDGSIDPSAPTSSKNSKPSSSNKSIKHEDLAVVPVTANYPIFPSQGDSKQPLRQTSTHTKTNEYQCQTTYRRPSNKPPISTSNQQKQNDHHCKRLNENTTSISDKSMIVEDINTKHDTTDAPLNKKIDDSVDNPKNSSKTNI
jgi:hypothetical protein